MKAAVYYEDGAPDVFSTTTSPTRSRERVRC